MPYRSRRLETLLGAQFEDLTFEHFTAIEGNQETTEADDLDWKVDYTGERNEIKFERAKDVAALANKSGGLIAIGIAEDRRTSSVKKVVGCSITDGVEREIRQALASSIFPLPEFDIRRLPDPEGDGTRGIILVGVPASPRQPHAVMAHPRPEYAYPRRAGNKTDWLTESDIATMYRERFAGISSRDDRLDEIEMDNVGEFLEAGQQGPLLIVSIVPEVPGFYKIDRRSYQHFYESKRGELPIGSNNQRSLRRTTVGSARIQLSDDRQAPTIHCEFHSDGSGSWGVVPFASDAKSSDQNLGYVPVSYITNQVLNALLILSQHATDHAGCTGTALARISLYASPYEHHSIPPPLMDGRSYDYLQLGDFEGRGNRFNLMGSRQSHFAQGEIVCVLNSVDYAGVELTRTAAHLTGAMLQTFGIIDTPQITEDGKVWTDKFYHDDERWWIRWCETKEIPYGP